MSVRFVGSRDGGGCEEHDHEGADDPRVCVLAPPPDVLRCPVSTRVQLPVHSTQFEANLAFILNTSVTSQMKNACPGYPC